MCVYIHSRIPTYTILRGNGQNNLLLEVHDQKYLNTAAKTRVMFLKHYYDYISLLLKTFTCLSSFFQDEIQTPYHSLHQIIFYGMGPTYVSTSHLSFTSYTKYCIFSYSCTSSPNAKHTHSLPCGGSNFL